MSRRRSDTYEHCWTMSIPLAKSTSNWIDFSKNKKFTWTCNNISAIAAIFQDMKNMELDYSIFSFQLTCRHSNFSSLQRPTTIIGISHKAFNFFISLYFKITDEPLEISCIKFVSSQISIFFSHELRKCSRRRTIIIPYKTT